MKRLAILLTICVAAGLFNACDIYEFGPKQPKEKTWDKVLILYQAGYNSLSPYLKEDMSELQQGDLPAAEDAQAILIVAHHTVSYLEFDTKTQPCIIRLYKDKKGSPVLDTLSRMSDTDLLTHKEIMARSLNYIAEQFKSDHYGLILSSHGTGWLPIDYYAHPDKYKRSLVAGGKKAAPKVIFPEGLVPFEETEPMPGPPTRTFGEERIKDGSAVAIHETDIKDLVVGLPYYFDYILMDVCLMGCVEVAYELKDKAGWIGFSPAEILANGLDYTKITTRLLKSGDPDLKGVLDDFYDSYATQTGEYKSACYTLVDCRKLDALASACRAAFATGHKAIEKVDPSRVQRLYRYEHHWFYDLKDILDQAGAGSSAVDRALDECVTYKVHTERFMPGSGGFVFKTYCGLSMYLPCNGSAYLDAYYQTLAWNKATSLVQ